MDFILNYLLSLEEKVEQQQGTQFTDLPAEALQKIAEYQETEIADAGGQFRLNVDTATRFRQGGDYYNFILDRRGAHGVEAERQNIQNNLDTWREELGRAILVNNWLRQVGGTVRMNPAQLLRLQRRYL